jgi:Mor family transcriptional regulator
MVMAQSRNDAIREQFEAGKTIGALAQDFRVTTSYIYRVIEGNA